MRKNLTEAKFKEVKRHIGIFAGSRRLAHRFDLSEKTILQIKGSPTFLDYTASNKAQHPPVKFSLKEAVLDLHYNTFRKNNSYIPPKSARLAIIELLNN